MWKKFITHPVTKFFSSLKLAVFLLVIFVLLAIWGTIVESQHTALYARWHVYLSPMFLATELLLFTSIFFATLVRLPFKKRFLGFYVIHLGLLTLFTGAALTAFYGIDGSLTIVPDQKNNTVVIQEPELVVHSHHGQTKKFSIEKRDLPLTVKEYNKPKTPYLSLPEYDIYVDTFLPFAQPRTIWKTLDDPSKSSHIYQFSLEGHNIRKEFSIADLDYESASQMLGPIVFQSMTALSQNCLKKALKEDALYVLEAKDLCLPLAEQPTAKKTIQKVNFSPMKSSSVPQVSIALPNNKEYIFYPEHSVYPIINDRAPDPSEPITLVNISELNQGTKLLFLKNNELAIGNKGIWTFAPLVLREAITLPWMGFALTPIRIQENTVPTLTWSAVIPQGDMRTEFAAKIRVVNKTNNETLFSDWVGGTDEQTITTENGTTLNIAVSLKRHKLPFSLMLTEFKMAKNPGTNQPASYESFVTVTDRGQETSTAHIYMNNPLKKGKFTFYQSSYFPLRQGNGFGSVLSVNYDPGRIFKYLGSLLIVMGALLFYLLRKKS
ncbi:MAG: cytochrome c biogenesis protein ResB [bacterium]|nr:cytochrome c biogenesis protein ResB [bacterium]MBU1919176.1 cytochrome c biogenesis protein ResB [bacterium]